MNDCICIKVIAGILLSDRDFLQYYRYTQKWVDLFEEEPAND
jgi:hypothetical protein